ncbi:MAG: HNH endonuclease [Rickettsiales bacterium]|jgi:hypothetical protein|nr:HNH endonuclease [Rickettsiales bacterium]
MELEQLHDLIHKLVKLDDHGKLSEKEFFKISEIIKYHDIFDYYVETLHFIADAVTPRELKRVGVIMLNHDIKLPCDVCGGLIRKPNHLEIDHLIPETRGGPGVIPNIGFAHMRCNRIKSDILCVNEKGEFDRDSWEFLQIMMIIRRAEEADNSASRRSRARIRPSGKCNHACTFTPQKTYYRNNARNTKNNYCRV